MATWLDLLSATRRRLDDFGPHDDDGWQADDAGLLWSNAELIDYLAEAEFDWCRVNPIRDSTTPEVCELALEAGTAVYDLDPSIQVIEDVVLDATGKRLLKQFHSTVRNDTPVFNNELEVKYYYHDLDHHSLRVWATPTAAGQLNLTVDRLPLVRFSWTDADDAADAGPEIRARFHYDLIHRAEELALLKRDADAGSAEAAAIAGNRFASRAGGRSNATAERIRAEIADVPLRVRLCP